MPEMYRVRLGTDRIDVNTDTRKPSNVHFLTETRALGRVDDAVEYLLSFRWRYRLFV